MNFSPKRKTVTFIVRIWAEYLHEQPPRWCGEIEAVNTNTKMHFVELNQIAELIHNNTLPAHSKITNETKK